MKNKLKGACILIAVAILLLLSVFTIHEIAIKIVLQGKGEIYIAR